MRWPLLLLLTLTVHAWAAPAERPNILFVYTDDQRWDGMGVVQKEGGGHARFPWLQTPNMDRLAAEGIRFRNAFVTDSLCAPSRAVFLTGRYNHLNGVANNHTPFPVESVTYASLLRAAGYATGFVGKWHMGSQSGQRPGFDFSASFVGQGKYFDCPIEVNGKSTPSKGWVDDVTTDYAIQFMREKQGQPFMMSVGFKATHGPFQPPERTKDKYQDETMYSVPNLDVPAIYLGAEGNGKKPKKSKDNSHLDYFRCITGADGNLGRLLAALDELKLAEKTVVIFSTDNGYYLGEHGLGDKRTAYDEAMRIPLIVRWPKHFAAGETRDQIALNIDYAPTFLDLAGVAVPAGMQGRSWVPLLKNKNVAGWRTSFFYEYFQEQKYSAPTVFAVRTESAKLITYPGHDEWTEVFDLKADPYETKNLVADPAHQTLLASLRADFDRQAKAVDFRIPDYADKGSGKGKSAARGAEGAEREYKCVFDLGFSQGRALDASEFHHPLTVAGITVVAGQENRRAGKFEAKSSIDVPKRATLNPAGGPWTVEAVIKPEAESGVIAAHGGKSQGFALCLDNGKPSFTVCSGKGAQTVTGSQAIVGRWSRVAGVITSERSLALYVDDRKVASSPLKSFIESDPHDALSIGVDNGSPVRDYGRGGHFQGLLERLQIFSGEKDAAKKANAERE